MIGSLCTPAPTFRRHTAICIFFGGIDVTNLKYQDAAHSGPKNFSPFQCPIDVKQDAVGAIYVTRAARRKIRVTATAKSPRSGMETEPTTNITPEKQSSIEAARRMNWSVLPGRVLVDLELPGSQSLELRPWTGKVLAKRDFREKGSVELPYVSAKAPICWFGEAAKAQAVTRWSSKGSRCARIGAIRLSASRVNTVLQPSTHGEGAPLPATPRTADRSGSAGTRQLRLREA